MRKILAALILLLACAAQAQYVQYYLYVTNTANLSNTVATIYVNGTTYTWATNASTAIQIQTTNDDGWASTNLFNITAFNNNGVRVAQFGTNGVAFSGNGIAVTVSASWAQLTNTSTASVDTDTVRVGGGDIVGTPTNQVNIASMLVTGIDAHATNSFAPYDLLLTNYAGLTSTQTISGPKFMTALFGTNSVFSNPNLTNGQNWGNPFRSPGLGTGSEQFGLGATATTNAASAFGDSASASDNGTTAIGFDAAASAAQASARRGGNRFRGQFSRFWLFVPRFFYRRCRLWNRRGGKWRI